jgi:hypothetical protein
LEFAELPCEFDDDDEDDEDEEEDDEVVSAVHVLVNELSDPSTPTGS